MLISLLSEVVLFCLPIRQDSVWEQVKESNFPAAAYETEGVTSGLTCYNYIVTFSSLSTPYQLFLGGRPLPLLTAIVSLLLTTNPVDPSPPMRSVLC